MNDIENGNEILSVFLVDELEAILAPVCFSVFNFFSFFLSDKKKRNSCIAVSEMSDIRSNRYRVIDVYLYRQANIII